MDLARCGRQGATHPGRALDRPSGDAGPDGDRRIAAGHRTNDAAGQFYTASEKAYEGKIRLGFATDTYDCDGEPAGAAQEVHVTLEEIRQGVGGFLGRIQQVPPPFSAKKIQGVPAYKLARRKKEVELKPVEVEIKEFTVSSLNGDVAEFPCRVSSGTYVRSVAHELGQKLELAPTWPACAGRRSANSRSSRVIRWSRSPKPSRREDLRSCACIRGASCRTYRR